MYSDMSKVAATGRHVLRLVEIEQGELDREW
jgi:hypothetical protein